MDKLKAFDQILTDPYKNANNSANVCKRLSMERIRAMEALQKSQRIDNKRKLQNNDNILNGSPISALNATDYVIPSTTNSINISDLVTNETININCNETASPSSMRASTSDSTTKDNKISFEPNEITGRSTIFTKDYENSNSLQNRMPRLSVNDIVSSSFAKRAQSLSDTLDEFNMSLDTINVMRDAPFSHYAASGRTSFVSLNTSRSLPRTADLSKNPISEESFPFDTTEDNNTHSSNDFAPGEMMQSKLLSDEISWAKEYATMPPNALSDEAKTKVSDVNGKFSSDFDLVDSVINSINVDDPNFSVGRFFNVRSDDIRNLVDLPGPNKCGAPIALIAPTDDETDDSVSTTNAELASQVTPRPVNHTYRVKSNEYKKLIKKRESKDSGNSSSNSFLLSMSTIDKLLNDMEIHASDSESAVVNALFEKVKPMAIQSKSNRMEQQRISEYDDIAEMILENKENLDPKLLQDVSLSDTKSFTESLLNSTEMKRLQQSHSSRSPLSPIRMEKNTPDIQVADLDHDGDIDEWPSTPIKASSRRVRRTKSPNDLSSHSQNITSDDLVMLKKKSKSTSEGCTRSPSPTHNHQLNSANLKEFNTSFNETVTGTLSNNSKLYVQNFCSSITATTTNSNNNNNNSNDVTLTANKDRNSPRSESPRSLTNSPMLAFSGLSSPVSCISPQLDSTSSMDHRYLSVGTLGKYNSSPTTTEKVSRAYGVPPSRSCSCSSPKSDIGTSMRSISRCSSSSEFSHRDGKMIPLKVSALQLSWGSTKLRKESRKSMQIKNNGNKRLVLRIEIHGPGFQIVNSHSNLITLQSQECRTIALQFCPTVVGIAIGMLSFHSPQGTISTNSAFLEIPLYGYGGHASITPKGLLQGPVGYPFLVMGELLDLNRPLERSFFICNKGPLLGFAIISVDSIGLNLPRLSNAFEVRPKKMLIPPNKMITVHIKFHPKRDDIKNIVKKIANVLTLSNMRIIYGDEAVRQRMRKLVQHMSSEEREKLTSRTLDKLWSTFYDEPDMPELNDIKENNDVVMDLMQTVNVKEIALTLNHHSIDETFETSSLYLPDADDTILFRTICTASPTFGLEPVAEYGEDKNCENVNDDGAVSSSTRPTSWSVWPSTIEFDGNLNVYNNIQTLTIKNSYKSRQYFEVMSNAKNLLSFEPSEGYIEPDGGEASVKVRIQSEELVHWKANDHPVIMVYMENERITVSVLINNRKR